MLRYPRWHTNISIHSYCHIKRCIINQNSEITFSRFSGDFKKNTTTMISATTSRFLDSATAIVVASALSIISHSMTKLRLQPQFKTMIGLKGKVKMGMWGLKLNPTTTYNQSRLKSMRYNHLIHYGVIRNNLNRQKSTKTQMK